MRLGRPDKPIDLHNPRPNKRRSRLSLPLPLPFRLAPLEVLSPLSLSRDWFPTVGGTLSTYNPARESLPRSTQSRLHEGRNHPPPLRLDGGLLLPVQSYSNSRCYPKFYPSPRVARESRYRATDDFELGHVGRARLVHGRAVVGRCVSSTGYCSGTEYDMLLGYCSESLSVQHF